MIETWEDFIEILENNQEKFGYTLRKFWIDKEKGFYENYIEISNNGLILFINDDFKEVSVVEKTMYGTYEIQIANKCTYDRYIQIINVLFNIFLKLA